MLDYVRTLDAEIPLYYIGSTSILGTINSINGESRTAPQNIWYPRYYGYNLTKALVDEYHANNMKVAVWSVPIEEYSNMVAMGVDIIATDYIGSNIGSKYGYYINSDFGWDDFDYSGGVEDGILNLYSGNSVKSKHPFKVFWGTYCVKILMKGDCTIVAPNLNTSISSDVLKEFVFVGMIDNKSSSIKITANSDSVIYELNYGFCEN